MCREPEGGEEGKGLCESVAYSHCPAEKKSGFQKGTTKSAMTSEMKERGSWETHGRDTCSCKGSEKGKEQSVIHHLFYYNSQMTSKEGTGNRHHTKQEMVPCTACSQNHRPLCKTMSWKPKSYSSWKGGWTSSRDTNPQHMQKSHPSHESSKLNSSQAFANIHDHIRASGLTWPWVQTGTARYSYLLTGLWRGPGHADLELSTVQPSTHLSPHRRARHTFTPGIHQKALDHHRCPMSHSQCHGMCLPGAASQEGIRRASKTERAQIQSEALSALNSRLHRSSVPDERLNSETKQVSLFRKRHGNSDQKKGCLRSSIEELQVKFVFSLVILVHTCTWLFLSLKKYLLHCLVKVVMKQSAVILN